MKHHTYSRLLNSILTATISLAALGVASAAYPENWTAPEVVPDNPVLQIMKSRWSSDDGRVVVAGAYMSFDERAYMEAGLNPGGASSWNGIKAEDDADLVSEAHPVDNVGLSYFTPMNVYFPTQALRDIWMEAALADPDGEQAAQRLQSIETEKVVLWIHKADRETQGHGLETAILVFSLDEDALEQPNICHARQVIRAIYTGVVESDELSECLALKVHE